MPDSKPVVELGVDNKTVINRWKSVRSAAKDLYITRQTVMNYCNNKTKKKSINLAWGDKNDNS